jgi:hypothetical protein
MRASDFAARCACATGRVTVIRGDVHARTVVMAWNVLESPAGSAEPAIRRATGRVSDHSMSTSDATRPRLLQPGTIPMTLTSLGILLIVNGVLLWAIMAALHRHTVALKNLQLQMETLLGRHGADAGGEIPAVRPRDAGKPPSRSRPESVDSSTR